MTDVIIDCYTDEPAGLGVPPYLGTYPRYLYGRMKEPYYLTIDDLRLYRWFKSNPQKAGKKEKTNIKTYNLSKNYNRVGKILNNAKNIVVILGVHTPGNYLSALPGTIKEVRDLLPDKGNKILTGPAVYGSQLEGGKFGEKTREEFDQILNFKPSYDEIKEYALKGAEIVEQIGDLRIAEIETGHGCQHGKCSYCMEPLKNKLEFRNRKDIVEEIEVLYKKGIRHFRLGKQTCFYAFPEVKKLLKSIWDQCPSIKTLHIDNANPINVINSEDKTKPIVKYTTPGNVAALGVESFDPEVVKANNLNSDPQTSYEAIKIINKYGRERGKNGMPKFLPGINILQGLNKESKETHKRNTEWLKKILDEDLLVRRINIRKVSIFPGTPIYNMCGNKFLKKNNQYYWKWRNQIRQEIDNPMLKKIVPIGTELKNVRMETYDGKKTFGRQIGTYPLIVGINKRLPLKKFYNIKVKDHMLRSVVGEVSKTL